MKKGLRSFLVLLSLAATLLVGGLVGAQPSPQQRPEGPPLVEGRAPVEPPAPPPPPHGMFDPSGPMPMGAPSQPGQPSPLGMPPGRDRGAALTATVLIFSPGDHPFFKFGHNAIWIHDASARDYRLRDRVYNYGTFGFDDWTLIPKFVTGRSLYWLSVESLAGTKAGYHAEGRGIVAQELDLTSAQKIELQRRLEENVRPENSHYKYDYYRDNCSTRVRDMIDGVIDGKLKAASTPVARMTYREHTLRLTADLPYEEVLLNLAMGDFIDKPITLWEEAFIPMELQKTLRRVTIPGPDGVDHPLVRREYIMLPTEKPEPALAPPVWWPYSLGFGLFLGGLMALLGRAARTNRGARILFGSTLATTGFVFGFFGCFFLFVWAATDHVVGYHNENIFMCVPWAIVLTGTGIRVAMNRVRAIYFAHKLITAAAAFAVLGTIVKVLPWFDQRNGFYVLFFVPFWLGAAYGIRVLRDHARAAEQLAVGKASAKLDAEPRSLEPKKTKKKKPKASVEEREPETKDASGSDVTADVSTLESREAEETSSDAAAPTEASSSDDATEAAPASKPVPKAPKPPIAGASEHGGD